ncbi:MAG: hypothetical protein RL722_1423 [Pseudomonadota bacterium]|jgi:DNA-binding protein H-NS
MATYQDLVAQKAELERQRAELEKQISDSLKAERSNAIAQIRGLMAEHGISVEDLGAKPARAPRGSGATSGGDGTRKVAPKYRDPATGETWSGRGLKPKWLKAALEAGRSLGDFAL